MRFEKITSVLNKSIEILLWSLAPILLAYIFWQIFTPTPLSSVNVNQPPTNNQLSINQLLKKNNWFQLAPPPPTLGKPIETTKLLVNTNFKLLGVFLGNKRPAIAVVAAINSDKSEVIIENKKSSLGIVLIRANDPFEVEIEDANGVRSLLQIVKSADFNSLYSKTAQSTNIYNGNNIAEVETNLPADKTGAGINQDNNQIPTNSNNSPTNSNSQPIKYSPINHENVNSFLAQFPAFRTLDKTKQKEIRELLSNEEIFTSLVNDPKLFEGLLQSYKDVM